MVSNNQFSSPELLYSRTSVLYGGQSSQITALSFSPGGTRLASAAMDETTIVWDTGNLATPMFHITTKAPVLSLSWFSESVLVCGLANGILVTLVELSVR